MSRPAQAAAALASGDAQPRAPAGRARVGRLDRLRVGPLRRARCLRLQRRRDNGSRDRRARTDASGCRRRAARQQPRRPLPPRTHPRRDGARRRLRAGRLGGRLLRRWERAARLRARRRDRDHLDALPPRDAGGAALARPDARRADRCQRRELDDREPRHAGRAAPRGCARGGHEPGSRLRGGGRHPARRCPAARAAACRGRDPADRREPGAPASTCSTAFAPSAGPHG